MKLKIHEFQKIINMMSKNLIYLLFLIPIISFSQVGVNTTAPNAMLDVQSTSNGVLIPRVQLTSVIDNTTITNPAGGALTTSTLIYNIAPAGVSPNNVVAGFYYWDNTTSRWIPIGGNTASDHDWYEEGTTSPPDAITDRMFHTGNVAIGKNTTNSPLEVETNTEFETGIKNNFISNTSQGVTRNGFYNQLQINSNDQSVGINTVLTGTGSGYQYGISNEISNTNSGNHIGAYNYLNGNGNGYHSGTENYLQGSGDGIHTGTKNEIVNSGNNINQGSLNEIHGSGSGDHFGTFNSLFGSGSGPQVGTANSINNSEDNAHTGTSNTITSSGNGVNYGVFNNLNGTGQGYQYANYSFIQNQGAGNQYGNYINMLGLGTGDRHGNYTSINNNQVGNNFGNYTILTGDGNGFHYGSFSSLGGNGDGEHTGNYTIVSGTGIGTKYASKNIVPVFAGGTHYGVYSEVLKTGSTNFAGYFLGNVGIGTTTLNTYTLPPSRGTNGQIMQTDGAGNVSWQNATTDGWSLNGNATIASPATPITYGTSTIGAAENFIGTTDNNDFTVGTNNIERMRIERTTGDVGIGIANPTERLHVRTNSDVTKSSILGEAQQFSSGTDYQNIGVRGFGRGIPAWGLGVGVMGIGDTTNSYFATGVQAHLGATIPSTPFTNQALYANGNGLGRAAVFTGGNIVIQDGTQANGRVLTSNATGVATWQSPGIDNVVGSLSATGVSIPYSLTNFVQTGSSITLPPGRYAVNVTMLLARSTTSANSPNNSFFWVRTSFSDSAGINPLSSPDIIGSSLASGNFTGTSVYAMLIGTIVINNTTPGNKTYYYVAGRCVATNTTETLTEFGSTYWAENNIIAYRLN